MCKPTSNLETQTPYLWIILGRQNSPLTKDFDFYYKKLEAWCKINARMYAFIGHDKDLDEDGNPKFKHIHALIVLKEGLKPRLSTSLNRIASAVEIDNVDVDIEKADNITSCIRYLIHRGYPTKHQYDVAAIIHNINKEDLEVFLNTEETAFTPSYLINMISICNRSVIAIVKQIGLKNYLKYRNLIIDVIKELQTERL